MMGSAQTGKIRDGHDPMDMAAHDPLELPTMDTVTTTTNPDGSQPPQRVAVITGMSGAGRRTAAHAMEDLGWYVVDNLPPTMLTALCDEVDSHGIRLLAVVADVRTRSLFDSLGDALSQLRDRGIDPEILFLEATDETIVKRQESSRRPLPLQRGGHLLEAIALERRMLSTLRADADLVIDTSGITTRQLAQRIDHAFAVDETTGLAYQVMSSASNVGSRWMPTSSSTCASCPTRSGCRSCAPRLGCRRTCPPTSWRNREPWASLPEWTNCSPAWRTAIFGKGRNR